MLFAFGAYLLEEKKIEGEEDEDENNLQVGLGAAIEGAFIVEMKRLSC